MPFLPWQPVVETVFGREAGRPDVLLWVPHDGGSAALFAALPELADACVAERALLDRYLALERDQGSSQQAHAIAQEFAARGRAVLLLEADLPRGLLDPARLPARALRNVYRHDAAPALFIALMRILGVVQRQLAKRVAELDPRTGTFLDVHTMSAHDPVGQRGVGSEAIVETPGSLARYCEAYLSRADAAPRPVDLITSCGEEQVADARLAEELSRALTAAGFEVALNRPYETAEHLVAYHAMKSRRGLSLDIPKPLALAASSRARLARAVVDGVLAAVSARREL